MLDPESTKAFIEVVFPNSQGNVCRSISPILIGNPSIITFEHNSLSTMVEAFSNSFRLVIATLENFGILVKDFKNGAFIERDSTSSMKFFYSGSGIYLRDRDRNNIGDWYDLKKKKRVLNLQWPCHGLVATSRALCRYFFFCCFMLNFVRLWIGN